MDDCRSNHISIPQVLVSGAPVPIDWEDLRQHTNYSGTRWELKYIHYRFGFQDITVNVVKVHGRKKVNIKLQKCIIMYNVN